MVAAGRRAESIQALWRVEPMVSNDGRAGTLSRPRAAEGGGRRPAFTAVTVLAKIARRIEGLAAIFRRRGSHHGRAAVPADGALNIAGANKARARGFGGSSMRQRMR